MASTKTKLPDHSDDVDAAMLDHDDGLYKHVKRPQWGVAILAWEKEGRRAYQFEDGRLRKFKKGYYSLMQPTEDVERAPEAVIRDLEDAVEANKGKAPPEVLEAVATFEEQVELFTTLYPKGFKDEKWISDHRGSGPGRALKRHREPSVESVQRDLSAERCREMLEADEHADLVETVTEILGKSSLVALKHVKVLRRLEDEEQKTFAESVADTLHGDEAFTDRFRRHLEVLSEIYGGRPSWRISTALPALMYPDNHVCVRHSAFIRQAAIISPMARYSRRARVGAYKNFRRVAFAVRRRLKSAGHEPRDLLDVHDFIWATLRNAALDHLGED